MNHQTAFNNWINNPLLGKEGDAELSAIENNKREIELRFGAELEFGTAGMRGIIGYGTNMMNIFTVRRAAEGLSRYILELGDEAISSGVAIAYDTRRKSREFAENTAGLLAQNGIKAHIFKDPRPVPMLSFAVRKLKCAAGVVITASHNPKEYNGFKVYGCDGAQMSPEATAKIVEHISAVTDIFSVRRAPFQIGKVKNKNVSLIKNKLEKAYSKELKKLALSKDAVKKVGGAIRLVYTPLHGTGYVPVMTILKKTGINATIVKEQAVYDSEFSTVEVPNPEFKEALTKGIELADKIRADAVFGTDPDCDRLGVAVRDTKGEFTALSGNQIGVLLLDYILTRLKETDQMPKGGYVVKSFVTTQLAKMMAEDFGVELIETPVGFKFIGEKIKLYEREGEKQFIFGFEESCGYLRGTHCRDKDAVVASMLFAEMVCYYTYKNISVFQRLENIYDRYGYFLDRNISISYSGINAMKEMEKVINNLRGLKIDKLDIYNVIGVRDYFEGIRKSSDGTFESIDMPKSSAIYYELENGSFICIRPSGTEPKLKIYYSIRARNAQTAEKFFNKLDKSVSKLLGK